MNPKLEGLVERFASEKGIEGDLAYKYEHFSNYVVIRDEHFRLNDFYPYESNIDKQLLEHLDFGRDKTESVDGFFCLIQNSANIIHIDTEKIEIEEWLKDKTNVTLSVVLIQTKKSGIDPKNINDLNIILSSKYEDQLNWKKFFDFKDIVSQLLKSKSRLNVEFTIVYTIGTTKDEVLLKNPNFVYKIDALKKTMKDFLWIEDDSKININIYDGSEILKLYEIQSKSIEAVDKTIDLNLLTSVEKYNDIAEMRLGTISIKEFKKVIYDFEYDRPYQLYEYNVRHSLDDTPVNKKISETLQDRSENIKFPLLNNGVTMIVDSMVRRGGDSSLELKNIRIVNGCQTSHSILNNCIGTTDFDNITLPIKIIATQNENILSEITFSSNNQNPIKPENLISLNKDIIILEKAYGEFNLTNEKVLSSKYYFERRQGQYYNVDRAYVIDIPEQARVFIASFLLKPHMPLQYKDQTLSEFKLIIDKCNEDQKQAFYKLCILSGILWCKIYSIVKTNYNVYEPGRYHILSTVILGALKELFISDPAILFNDEKKIEHFLANIDLIETKLFSIISSASQLESLVKNASEIIDNIPELAKTQKGRIHYRKFYIVQIINNIIIAILKQNGSEQASTTANS